jgi:preprotein translocase subunit SecD
MNDKKTWKLYLTLAVIAALTVLAIVGAGPTENRVVKSAADIRTGIDIRGGINAILVPVYPEGTSNPDVIQDLNTAKEILTVRLDSKGIYDKNLNIDTTNERIILEIPWAQNETNYDPQAALRELGSTARLTFQEVDESMIDANGNPLPTGKIIMDGGLVDDADYGIDTETNGYSVFLTLTKEGQTAFADATGRLINRRIAIFMDDVNISAPTVSTRIDSPNARITGNFTMEEAKSLADRIRSGALPCKLETVSVDSISPTLGRGALDVTLMAGLLAYILVCLYMILMYRLPGLVAAIAVTGMVALQVLLLANLNISLTLPGIAGIILSVGMGVDANVVISERIREELKAGKTFRSAVDSGFNRAFVAVLDSNITTIIAAGALYFLGTGPIRGFGLTLGLGVLVSFLSAVTVSRIMLRHVSMLSFARKKWLYRVNA